MADDPASPEVPLRARILAAVHAAPGSTISDLVRGLGIGWGTAYHHLRALQDEGAILVVRVGRRSILLARDGRHHPEVAFLRGRTARVVAQAILDRPGLDALALAEAALISPRSAYYHIARLSKAGLVERARGKGFAPTQRLREILTRR